MRLKLLQDSCWLTYSTNKTVVKFAGVKFLHTNSSGCL